MLSRVKSFILVCIALVLIVSVATGCGTKETGTKDEEIKIGLQGVLSGNSASIGDDARKAADFLAKKVNEEGGINGKKIKLVVIDDKGDPNEAVEATKRLIEAENVRAIVNVGTSTTVLASQQVTGKAKIPMVAHIPSDPRITNQGNPYMFRVSVTADGLAFPVADYAAKKLGLKQIAVINRNDGYGNSIKDSFVKKFTDLGGQITTVQTYNPDEKDFKAYLIKAKETNPDGLMLTGFYADAGLITKQAREVGITIQILGQNTMTTPGYIQIAASSAEGAILSANYLPGVLKEEAVQKFVTEWKKEFGTEPTAYAAHGYDALAVIIEAIKQGNGSDPQTITDQLLKIKNFQGASGVIISFLPNGDVEKAAVMAQVKEGKLIMLSTSLAK